jgi:sphinganine-1-phosphate aldolase
VYGGEEAHTDLQNQIYALYSLTNPLHPDIFPSTRKMESEVIRMTISMLQGDRECVGAMSSGGTESILLAMKSYRDWGLSRGLKVTEVVAPKSAHPAFDKAANYFGIVLKRAPIDPVTFRADVAAMEAMITPNTVALVGSAPQYPHGVIDDIPALAKIAQERGIGMHTDACLGGYFLAWARQFCDDITPFDFSVPGVTTMSCDTHKYGYSVKGTSTILFRNAEWRKHMYFVETEWPGGIYASPTIAGSRAGGLIACTWASLLATGKDGYMRRAGEIHKTAMAIKEGIRSGRAGPHIVLQGESYSSVVAFCSKKFNVFELMDEMKHKHGWVLNPLQMPQGLHLCVTYPIAGKEEEFLDNLRDCAAFVAENGSAEQKGSAAVYGMTSTFADRVAVADAVQVFLDCSLEDTVDAERALADGKSEG